MSVLFSEEGCEIFKKNNIKVQGESILKLKEKNGIYILRTNNNRRNVQSLHSVYQGSIISNGKLWYRRMGHLSYSYLNNLKDLGLHFEKTNLSTKLFHT